MKWGLGAIVVVVVVVFYVFCFFGISTTIELTHSHSLSPLVITCTEMYRNSTHLTVVCMKF